MIDGGIGSGIELLANHHVAGTLVAQDPVIARPVQVEVDPPVRIVHVVDDALQALAVDVSFQDAVGAEVIDLVDVVAADLVADADLVPLLAIERELAFSDGGVVGPGYRRQGATQPIGIGIMINLLACSLVL